MQEEVQEQCCSESKQKEAPAAEEQDKMVRWSVALSSFPSLLLFYSAWNPTVWLQLCVLECVCSPRRQDDKKAVSLFVTWVGLFCTLALTCSIQQTLTVCICMRVYLRPGAGREREWWWAAHTWSCEVVQGRGMPEGVLRVFMNTDISQSRKRVGAGLTSLAVQQWRAVVRLHVLSVLSPALTSLAALQLPAGFGARETRSAGGSFFSSASLELFSTKQSPKHRHRAAKIKIR